MPIGHHSYNGHQADVGTVVAQMEALRVQVELPECLVIGGSKLLSQETIPKLLGQNLHFLAPLPKSEEGRRGEMNEMSAEQKQLWHLLGIRTPCSARKRRPAIIVLKLRFANGQMAA